MPKIERNIEINAPAHRVWEVLTDLTLIPKWFIIVKDINELEPQKYFVKSNIGDYTEKVIEQVENKKITMEVDFPGVNGHGFVINEKGDMTELTYWEDFKKITSEKLQAQVLEISLTEIKKLTEYLEDGGDPDEYDRKQILVKP